MYSVHLESESDPSAKASSGEVGSLFTGSALYVWSSLGDDVIKTDSGYTVTQDNYLHMYTYTLW